MKTRIKHQFRVTSSILIGDYNDTDDANFVRRRHRDSFEMEKKLYDAFPESQNFFFMNF
jgi:hypothetical protein